MSEIAHMLARVSEPGEAFGYSVMGPILTEMLWKLHTHLDSSSHPEDSIVLFCARGGLTLRRALQQFGDRVGLKPRLRQADLMISRLTAARVALQRDAAAVTPLIEKEFAGRSCAEAARALTDVHVSSDARWDVPFNIAKYAALLDTTKSGEQVRQVNDEQADLLRLHIDRLRGASSRVILCDTGVFGSIGRYLGVGIPQVQWSLTLLFRANYKKIPAPHFGITTGVICESDGYLPWQPVTAILLYWQLMEAMLEPDLLSVKYYRLDTDGDVVSDLQIANWQAVLKRPANSVLAGALRYVATLSPASIKTISCRGRLAWNRLQRMIVFPTVDDVSVLAAGRRGLDFGADDEFVFASDMNTRADSFRNKIATAHCSMWPEGEYRRQFPKAAGGFLLVSEIARFMRAVYGTITER